jgi:cytochrome c
MRTIRTPGRRAVSVLAAAAVVGGMAAAAPGAAAATPADVSAGWQPGDLTAVVEQTTTAEASSLSKAQKDALARYAKKADPTYDVLVFSKTAGFRHDSIPAGIAAIKKLGAQNGFTVTATEDATAFTAANLAPYEAVVWLSTTSDVLNASQQTAFENYIKGGGGYVGIHAASDTEYTWPWYGKLVGAYFRNHPNGTPTATVDVEDFDTASTCHLPAEWVRTDEWYNFQPTEGTFSGGSLPFVGGNGPATVPDYSPRSNANINVLASLDESTYDEVDGNNTDDDHPIAWYQEFDGGRSFYTGGGHTQASFKEPNFTQHLLGGIEYAAGETFDACADPAPTDASFEQVTLAKGVDKVGEPMAISVLPDGRVLHNARDGRIFLTDLDGNTRLVATVPVYMHDEDGLQSMAVSPDFENDGWVYIYYAPKLNTPAGDAPETGTAATWETWKGYNQLSRVKMVNDAIDLSTEQKLLEVEASRGICCHAGGGIDFDAQGNLYLSTGDDSNPFSSDGYAPLDERSNRNPAFDAQRSSGNTNDLRGKIVRIKPNPTTATYTIPNGNLFPEANDPGNKTRPEIYAMGFRNPFRMTVDKATGYVYLGEYGPDAGSANPNRGPGGIVEFNQVRQAGNFGWPYCTGPNTQATTYNEWDFAGTSSQTPPKFNCAAPVNNSPHNTGLTNLPPAQPAWIYYDGGNVTYNGQTTNEFGGGGEAPMAGPVYNYDPDLQSDVKFPEYFDNHFFAGEWTRGWIKDITMEADGDVAGIDPFFDSSTLYAVMDMEFGPDGSLYVLDYGNGGYFQGNENSAVYKINAINEGQRSPTAVARATPNSGQAPLSVQFSSEGSSDPDEGDSIASYSWDFDGDGDEDSTQPNPTFVYQTNGEYDARLTVTDSTGRTGSATVVVTVGNTRPEVEMVQPVNGGFFDFGDEVTLDVEVTDEEETDIDCADIDVSYILGHDSHGHPLSETTGCAATVKTVRDEGHDPAANIFGVLNASYTDAGANGVRALTGSAEVVLNPKRKQVEHWTDVNGVDTEATTDPQGGARNLSNIDDNDWVSYDPVSLYQVPELRFRVASAGAGGTIEARLDSPTGQLAGSVQVAPTGGWQNWETVSMDIDEAAQTGTHELYLVFQGATEGQTGLFNVNFFDAWGKGVSANSAPRVTVSATPTQGTAPLTVEFDGEATDFDGDDLTYAWDFGVEGSDDTATTPDGTWSYDEPGTYVARLTVTDSAGAVGSAAVTIRVIAQCGVQQSDEFDGSTLDGKWQVEAPTGAVAVSGGGLQLPIQSGSMYGPGGNAVDLVSQAAPEGPWTITAKLTAQLSENYHQAGLRIYADQDNWASVHMVTVNGARQMEFIYENGGSPRNGAGDNTPLTAEFPTTYYVRLISDGTDVTAAYSADGTTFTPVGQPAPLSAFAAGAKVGPHALSGGAGSQPTATFDWIRFDPDGTSGGSTLRSDEFDGTALDKCRWNAIVREDPTKYEVSDGALKITTTPGDLYQTPNAPGTTNLVLQSGPDGDYTMETRLAANFTTGYSQGGLMVYGDDDNYVKLDVIADDGQTRINRVELRSEVAGAITNPQPQVNLPANVSNYRLRLVKTGNSYTGEFAVDGGEWTSVGAAVTNATAGMDVGVFALGVNQPDRVAQFDYFRMTEANTNRNPVAVDDSAETTEGTAVDVDVLANDTDADGDTLALDSVTDPANGTATISGTKVRYTPDAGHTGADTFDYVVSDGNGGTDTGTVTVTTRVDCELDTPDDSFDGTELDPCRWNAIVAEDPDLYEVSDGALKITTTLGEIYRTGTAKSNFILQSADHAGADWEIATRLDASALAGGYSQAGVMVYGSDADYVKLAVIADDGRTEPNRIELRSEVGNQVGDTGPGIDIPAGTASDIWLRLTKSGNDYTGAYSADNGATWIDIEGAVTNAASAPRFGLFTAGVLRSGDVVAFDEFLVDGVDPEPVPVPDTKITAGPSGTKKLRTAVVRFTATGPGADGATFECALDSGAWKACTSPTTFTNLKDGTHRVRVRAISEGGTDATPAVITWKVDTAGPSITSTSPRGTVKDRTPTVRATVKDVRSGVTKARVKLKVDGKNRAFKWSNGKLTWTPGANLSYGKHTVRVEATDGAGNKTVKTWSFRIQK